MGLGYTSPIKINCSVQSLESVLNMLDNMKYDFTSKTTQVLPIFNRMNKWYGYDQYDAYNNCEATAIFTMSIFQAIDKTFGAYLEQDVLIDEIKIKDYYDNQPNKLQAMRNVINNSIKIEDALVANIILNTRNELSAFGLTTTNILNVPAVEARMDEYYGYVDSYEEEDDEPDIVAQEIVDEMNGVHQSEVSEVIPVTTNIVVESTAPNESLKELNKPQLVFRTAENARDARIISSIQDEINISVQSIIEQMREASLEMKIPDLEAEEVSADELEQFSKVLQKQETIDKTKEQYQELDQELEINETGAKEEDKYSSGIVSTDAIKAANTDDPYFVNASYLMQFTDAFSDKRAETVGLTEEEVEALKKSSVAELGDSINRLVEAIKLAEEKKKMMIYLKRLMKEFKNMLI